GAARRGPGGVRHGRRLRLEHLTPRLPHAPRARLPLRSRHLSPGTPASHDGGAIAGLEVLRSLPGWSRPTRLRGPGGAEAGTRGTGAAECVLSWAWPDGGLHRNFAQREDFARHVKKARATRAFFTPGAKFTC